MKKLDLIFKILIVFSFITLACNISINLPGGQPPDEPPQDQYQPGQPQPGMPEEPQPGQPGGPQPGEPQPGQPGEPQPGQPPEPPTTPGGVCAGAPQIPYFNANPTSIISGQSTTLSWGTITNGATGSMVASATIEPGLGEVGSGASSRSVKPKKTTTYTLTATGCGGTATRQVTVNVSSSGGSTSPTNTPGIIIGSPIPLQIATLDLALSNIYPASDGKIMFTIRNNGTSTVSGSYKVVCSGSYIDSGGNHSLSLSGKYADVNLSAGKQADYETGYSRNPSITEMWVSCTLTPPQGDSNSANNTMGMTRVK